MDQVVLEAGLCNLSSITKRRHKNVIYCSLRKRKKYNVSKRKKSYEKKILRKNEPVLEFFYND